jgi:hypothetical protein
VTVEFSAPSAQSPTALSVSASRPTVLSISSLIDRKARLLVGVEALDGALEGLGRPDVLAFFLDVRGREARARGARALRGELPTLVSADRLTGVLRLVPLPGQVIAVGGDDTDLGVAD